MTTDDLTKMFDEARADFTPPKTAAEVWERFCGRQDALKLDDLKGAIERFRDQPIPRFDDPEVQAALREQAVTGRAFSAALADELEGRNAGKTAGQYLREAAAELPRMSIDPAVLPKLLRRQALEEVVAHLSRFIKPNDEERARLTGELDAEVKRLAETTGHTYQSALEQMSDVLRGVAIVRHETPWEDLRDHLARLRRSDDGPRMADMPQAERIERYQIPEPALPKRQRPRNKYDHRPPGKR